jgi:hypothetical protein
LAQTINKESGHEKRRRIVQRYGGARWKNDRPTTGKEQP